MKDLVIKLTGDVVSSNLDEFVENTMAMIKATDKPLVSDGDFVAASQTVKDCKAAEVAIDQAKQDALQETVNVAKLFDRLDEVSYTLRTTRLSLEKKVASEKDSRKLKLVDSYCEKLEKEIDRQELIPQHASVDRTLFNNAIKGKRSLEAMEKALGEVLSAESQRFYDLKEIVTAGFAAIEHMEEKFPGLFPDKNLLALEQPQSLAAIIESRCLKFEKSEREKKDKEDEGKRIEAERIAEAEKEATEQAQDAPDPEAPVRQHDEPPKQRQPQDTVDLEPSTEELKFYRITLLMRCTTIEAQCAARKINDDYGSYRKVNLVEV